MLENCYLGHAERDKTSQKVQVMGMFRFKQLLMRFVGLFLISQSAAAVTTMTNLSVESLPGEVIQIRLEMDGPMPDVGSFTVNDPARLSIDLPNTQLGINKRMIPVDLGSVRSLRVLESGGRSRIVVNMDSIQPHTIRADNNILFVQITPKESAQTRSLTPLIGSLFSEGTVPDEEVTDVSITGIDFRRGVGGEAQVAVTMSDSAVVVDVRKNGNQVLVDFIGTVIEDDLVQRLDVVDFATPVTTIDTYRTDQGVQLQISAVNEAYDYLAYQTGNTYQLEMRPLTEQEVEEAKKDELGYSGEKLSLNFQNIEVRAILQLIADFTGLNIVASDTVNGNITLRLKNVPWDQAFDIILKTRGLGKRQTGNVVLVAPNEELAEREKKELESRSEMIKLAPMNTRYFQINYAKASDISELLNSGEKKSLLSERGQVTVDERTNTLMVLDSSAKMSEIAELIEKLDIPIRQVMVESRIVVANDDFGRDLGIRSGLTRVTNNGSNATSGSLDATNSTVSSFNSGVTQSFPSSVNQRLNVDLPVSGGGSLAFSVLNSNEFLVDLELSAMQSEGKGELVSNPRVITSNQKEASNEQGVEIPYTTLSAEGVPTIAYKKAVLSLKVTPQITPDNRVVMDLYVSKDSVGSLVGNEPSINTRQINTQVLVNNGDTVVLGGIYENEKLNSVEKVPLLGDIPILGALFRRTINRDNKAELLIFVTPKILKEQLNASY